MVDRHYRQKWGEIDLICRDGETWVFVEVKTRSSVSQPSAIDSITPRKRQRIYPRRHELHEMETSGRPVAAL